MKNTFRHALRDSMASIFKGKGLNGLNDLLKPVRESLSELQLAAEGFEYSTQQLHYSLLSLLLCTWN